MNNPLKKGILMEHSVGIGTVTEEKARRELTGGSEMDPKEAILESAPESDRWDPVHGSTGTQAPETSSEDEDEDGRSDSARLVEEGIHEAEHDRMLQATEVKTQFDER